MEEIAGENELENGQKNPTPDPQHDGDDVDRQLTEANDSLTTNNECDIPMKKRKTRRGKHKRRYPPYNKNERNNKSMKKPEAPYNSNQFLLEDHGIIEELDEKLRNADQTSTTTSNCCRTRDSSFSVDSDGEFYSSPDDEEQFLIKDFVDQYESVQAERLQSMSKDELIREYLLLESKLMERQKKKTNDGGGGLQDEVERLTIENEALKRENAVLKNAAADVGDKFSSEDSESDSSDDSSSCCSSSSCDDESPPVIDYSKTNGHTVETA